MIHYHGTPCGSTREDVARFAQGRHMLIPFLRPEDVGTVADVSQSFCIDSSAYTAWKKGTKIDFLRYHDFVRTWKQHPAFDFAVVDDVIDGSEAENDFLIDRWPEDLQSVGVPVWHLHESFSRLLQLCKTFARIALGSSGQFSSVGTRKWWQRIDQAMAVVCDSSGRPMSKLHGLRMLNPKVFTKLPLASADSTNVVRNSGSLERFGMYKPPKASTRMEVIASRIESHQSQAVWVPLKSSVSLF